MLLSRRKKILARLTERDGEECVWCSLPLTPNSATFDHALPLSSGGSTWVGNLLLACEKCNMERQSSSLEKWRNQCERENKRVRRHVLRMAERRLGDPRAKARTCQRWNHILAKHLKDTRRITEDATELMDDLLDALPDPR